MRAVGVFAHAAACLVFVLIPCSNPPEEKKKKNTSCPTYLSHDGSNPFFTKCLGALSVTCVIWYKEVHSVRCHIIIALFCLLNL